VRREDGLVVIWRLVLFRRRCKARAQQTRTDKRASA
jgi:hypothetical protein